MKLLTIKKDGIHIRNLYRKRQGLLMMWGSLTFWVIAQVAYVVFWLMGTKF